MIASTVDIGETGSASGRHWRASSEDTPVGRGARIGRYVVVDELGRGAMGVVHRAYDPKLHREIALKVMHGRLLGDEAEARLVREARAMAKLNHPNVVAVFDVEFDIGSVVIAMECVRGPTLRQWLESEPRPWQAIVDRFVAAGRGLQAAHDVGMLHRDFKPSNVLIDVDGRPKVADFGLAVLDDDDDTHRDETAEGTATVGPTQSQPLERLTRHGETVGTPAYMAPEQFAGVEVDARADQYAFCVALWQALTGAFPFTGDTFEALAAAKRGQPPSWPRSVRVPLAIARALRKGLSPRPGDRFAKLSLLLGILEAHTSGRRRRRAWLAAAGTLALGSSTLIAAAHQPSERACAGAKTWLATWTDEKRGAIEERFGELDSPYAAPVLERVGTELDAYANAWATDHERACRAGAEGLDTRLFDQRMICLERARQSFDATVAVLADADAEVLGKSHEMTGALPSLASCADETWLLAEVPPPEDAAVAAEVEAIRAVLARVDVLVRAGRYDHASTQLAELEPRVRATRYEPLRAETTHVRATLEAELGRLSSAERLYRQVLADALRLGLWKLAAVASVDLIALVGDVEQRTDEGLAYAGVARAYIERAGSDPRSQASWRAQVANVYSRRGAYEQSEVEQRMALKLRTQVLGPDHPDTQVARMDLASVLLHLGRYDDAENEQRTALASLRRALGSAHPDAAAAQAGLGSILWRQGRYTDGERELEAALASLSETLGPDHPKVAATRNNLAGLYVENGRYVDAEREHRKALASRLATFGPDHPEVGRSINNLAGVLADLGRSEEAEAEYRRALEVLRGALGPDHPSVASVHTNLASVLQGRRAYAEAEVELRQVLAVVERAFDMDHPQVAEAHGNLSVVLFFQERNAEAMVEVQAALERLERRLGPDHPEVAYWLNHLANVEIEAGALDDAEQHYRRALDSVDRRLGPEHPLAFDVALGLGDLLRERGRSARAVPYLRRACEGLAKEPSEQRAHGRASFSLARALMGSSPREAIEHARRARDIYARTDGLDSEKVRTIDAWLRRHGRGTASID